MIFFYKVLYTFKQVEVQINPKYQSAEAVIETLRKYRITEVVLLTIYTVMAILSITMWIGQSFAQNKKEFHIVYTLITYI